MQQQQQAAGTGATRRPPLGMAVKDLARSSFSPGRWWSSSSPRSAIARSRMCCRNAIPDHELTAIVTRAAIAGATTTTPGWAMELVQLGQGDFLQVLTPVSVFQPLSGMGTSLTFGPNAGSIKIPSRTTTPVDRRLVRGRRCADPGAQVGDDQHHVVSPQGRRLVGVSAARSRCTPTRRSKGLFARLSRTTPRSTSTRCCSMPLRCRRPAQRA